MLAASPMLILSTTLVAFGFAEPAWPLQSPAHMVGVPSLRSMEIARWGQG